MLRRDDLYILGILGSKSVYIFWCELALIQILSTRLSFWMTCFTFLIFSHSSWPEHLGVGICQHFINTEQKINPPLIPIFSWLNILVVIKLIQLTNINTNTNVCSENLIAFQKISVWAHIVSENTIITKRLLKFETTTCLESELKVQKQPFLFTNITDLPLTNYWESVRAASALPKLLKSENAFGVARNQLKRKYKIDTNCKKIINK